MLAIGGTVCWLGRPIIVTAKAKFKSANAAKASRCASGVPNSERDVERKERNTKIFLVADIWVSQ